MKTSICAVPVLLALMGAACAGAPAASDEYSPDQIIALERGAIDRWGKGDPQGYYEIMASEETYFDPITEKRLDGLVALKAHVAPFAGKISIERYEMLDPKVQRDGNVAVLTFNLLDHGARLAGVDQGTPHWNSTEVYRRSGGAWRIVHSHWSYVKPELVPKK